MINRLIIAVLIATSFLSTKLKSSAPEIELQLIFQISCSSVAHADGIFTINHQGFGQVFGSHVSAFAEEVDLVKRVFLAASCPYENWQTSRPNDYMLHKDPIAATVVRSVIWVIF